MERRESIKPYLQGILGAVVVVLDASGGYICSLQVSGTSIRTDDRLGDKLHSGVEVRHTSVYGDQRDGGGKHGWIAANYSQGHYGFDAGYVEMGGASAQIAVPMAGAGVAVARNVARTLNAENMEALVIERGWEMANLEAVVNLWAGEGDRADVATLWGGAAQLAMVERELNLGNQAKVEAVGHHVFFSASYRLGAELGYRTYKEVMFGPDLTEQERTEILDPIDPNVCVLFI